MGRKRIVAVDDPSERKRLRATLGPLQTLRVIASTARRYDYAAKYFLWFRVAYFGKLADELEELDVQCSVFIKVCWEEGETRSLVADVLSGLGHGLSRKRILRSVGTGSMCGNGTRCRTERTRLPAPRFWR